jgi:hypothetical protein
MSELVRLGRELVQPADALATLGDRCAAYLPVLPRGTVIGGLTSGREHGLWLPAPGPGELPEFVLTRPGARPRQLAHSERGGIVVRRRSLAAHEMTVVNGLPAQSVERTWVDLAERLSLPDLVAAGDSALRGGSTHERLAAAVQTGRRRRGIVRARQALQLLDARSRSRPESHLRCALVCGGLPWPEVNVAITNRNGEWLAEPDLHYRFAKLVLEYNGADHAELGRMRRDITREIDIEEDGWKVVVFGPAEVFGHPWRIVPHVRALLDARAPGWSHEHSSQPEPARTSPSEQAFPSSGGLGR